MVTTRLLDQEPDAIALIPDFPDFLVVGTYSLVSTDDDSGPAARRGSLQILPFSESHEQSAVTLDRKDFEFGVYDINFHPQFRNLLGVATSNSRVLIYCVKPTLDQTGRLECLTLQEIGTVMAEEDVENEVPGAADIIITQIQFIDEYKLMGMVESIPVGLDSLVILIAATTQSGNTTLIRMCMTTADTGLENAEINSQSTQLRVVHRQSYDLEAWTVLPLFVESSPGLTKAEPALHDLVVISGGDDSQLLVSRLNVEGLLSNSNSDDGSALLDLDEITCTRLTTDHRTHAAGIVSTCRLNLDVSDIKHFSGRSQVFLTGSYDEHVRLFHLKLPEADHGRSGLILLSEFIMPGGVWRIMLLDSYKHANSFDYLLLIAGHTAGALIVRLTCTPPEHSFTEALESWHYTWKIETHFTQHQSLVYAVAARRKKEQRSMWQVISTSFYDKLICAWEWEDYQWRSQYSTV